MVLNKSLKRFLVFGILGLFMIILASSFVIAIEAEDTGRIIGETFGQIGKGIGGFIGAVFGDTLLGGGALSKIFMALLLGMFVYSALGTFFTNKVVLNLATIAATGLALIGLPPNFLESALTGYGAMGIAILMIVPFLVILWFSVKVKSVLMARGIWLFYTTYYFALYIQELFSKGSQVWPNFIAIVLGGIMFFFILGVRGFIFKGEMEEVVEKGKRKVKERKTRLALEMERLKADE